MPVTAETSEPLLGPRHRGRAKNTAVRRTGQGSKTEKEVIGPAESLDYHAVHNTAHWARLEDAETDRFQQRNAAGYDASSPLQYFIAKLCFVD